MVGNVLSSQREEISMKLTKSRLKQIIKEELQSIYSEELTPDEEDEKKDLEGKLDKLKHK